MQQKQRIDFHEASLFSEEFVSEAGLQDSFPELLLGAWKSQIYNMEPEGALLFAWEEIDPEGEERRRTEAEGRPFVNLGRCGFYVPSRRIERKEDDEHQHNRTEGPE